MWLRFRNVGLPSDSAVAQVPRSDLLVVGLRVMILPALAAGALLAGIALLRERRQAAQRTRLEALEAELAELPREPASDARRAQLEAEIAKDVADLSSAPGRRRATLALALLGAPFRRAGAGAAHHPGRDSVARRGRTRRVRDLGDAVRPRAAQGLGLGAGRGGHRVLRVHLRRAPVRPPDPAARRRRAGQRGRARHGRAGGLDAGGGHARVPAHRRDQDLPAQGRDGHQHRARPRSAGAGALAAQLRHRPPRPMGDHPVRAVVRRGAVRLDGDPEAGSVASRWRHRMRSDGSARPASASSP
jgi:hypothetical protein